MALDQPAFAGWSIAGQGVRRLSGMNHITATVTYSAYAIHG